MAMSDLAWHRQQAFCDDRRWTDDAAKTAIVQVLHEKEEALAATESRIRALEAERDSLKELLHAHETGACGPAGSYYVQKVYAMEQQVAGLSKKVEWLQAAVVLADELAAALLRHSCDFMCFPHDKKACGKDEAIAKYHAAKEARR
jgi:hypothetical protein